MKQRHQFIEAVQPLEFDTVVVGGGIAGACAAWDASLRGLKVALLERQDFGGSTSAQSLKILHGGIRYLQHLDLVRLRSSCRERAAFLRIAPHLTRPLPFTVPTYGYGMQGKLAFKLAFMLLAVLTADRNKGIRDDAQKIPGGYMMSRDAVLRRFKDIQSEKLTGAAVFYDGQILNPPRLVYAVIRSAIQAGAAALNYCTADELIVEDNAVVGVYATDALTGKKFAIRCRSVINAAGPYASETFRQISDSAKRRPALSRDMAIVLRRPAPDSSAIAVQTKYKDPDAILSRGNRHLFIVPWRGYTLIGVNSRIYQGDPNDLTVGDPEINAFIDEINEAQPGMRLTRDDVSVVNAGLLPFGDNDREASNLSFGKRSLVADHRDTGGPTGLVSAVSVRWTMGRATAQQAVDLVERLLRGKVSRCGTLTTPVYGGDFETFDRLYSDICDDPVIGKLADDIRRNIAVNHGSNWPLIRNLVDEDTGLAATIPGTVITRAEVVFAARNEQVVRLNDVILRRTDIGTGERPSPEAVQACAELVARELGWSQSRLREEAASTESQFPFSNTYPGNPRLQGAA